MCKAGNVRRKAVRRRLCCPRCYKESRDARRCRRCPALASPTSQPASLLQVLQAPALPPLPPAAQSTKELPPAAAAADDAITAVAAAAAGFVAVAAAVSGATGAASAAQALRECCVQAAGSAQWATFRGGQARARSGVWPLCNPAYQPVIVALQGLQICWEAAPGASAACLVAIQKLAAAAATAAG